MPAGHRAFPHKREREDLGESMREELLASVGLCCNLVAPVFLEDPGRQELQPLMESLARADAAELAGEWPLQRAGQRAAVGQAFQQLCSGAQRAVASPQEASRAFHHLFVGPGHLAAPPWGSVYTDHEKVKFGRSCLDLGLWMRRRGIEQLGPEGEPADHIGRMLALLGWIAAQRPELLEEYLAEHLLTWSHHYFERLQPAAQREAHPLYCGAAVLADELLLALQEELGLQVSYPRFFM